MTRVGKLPDQTRGFDMNERITARDAVAAYQHGMRFVIRYVRRASAHPYDISVGEVLTILNAGLGFMLVQHVAQEGLLGIAHALPEPLKWSPSSTLGRAYGSIAAEEARRVGYMRGANLWCDLEGVSHQSSAKDVISYCNSWYDAVAEAGFVPGLYVGFDCGLSSDQLYHNLKYSHYWAAYNLNGRSYPAVRGVQMQQGAFPKPADRIPGTQFQYDTDLIFTDKKGGSPLLVIPK